MSDLSDGETLERQNDKDEDFNIDDYCNDFSDDSCSGTLEGDKEKLNKKESTKPQDEKEGIELAVSGGHRFDKKLVCIKYPGNVINYDKAIETLGGIGAISKTVDTPNRRLELRFRPNDGYCKPTCGDRHNANAFLLRVRVKKSRVKKVEETSMKDKTDIATNETKDGDYVESAEFKQMCSQSNRNESQDESSVSELAQQVQNCSVSNAAHPSDPCRKIHANDDKCTNDISVDVDKNMNKNKKNIPPTFDRDKYEDLSKDKAYELPRVKVLGQVETEFRFTILTDDAKPNRLKQT
ncbi:hypothetical protein KM043_012186 [Ampulex compressa]|nr:hypothetical protein KM043_012186 [Ampulex compressa]